jgi:hypothetical protein
VINKINQLKKQAGAANINDEIDKLITKLTVLKKKVSILIDNGT